MGPVGSALQKLRDESKERWGNAKVQRNFPSATRQFSTWLSINQ